MKLTWEAQREKYSSGERLKLGPFVVGGYHWHGSSQDSDKPYRVTCRLPGMKEVLGDEAGIASSRRRLEKAVYHWITRAFED